MIAAVTTGFASLVLLGVAVSLLMQAAAKPPVSVRTESHRSPAEYDHHRKSAALRKRGYVCLMAGLVSLATCVVMVLALSLSRLD